MRNTLLLVSLSLMVASTAGCKCGFMKTPDTEADTGAAKVAPQSEWTSGDVIDVWPFKNGEVLVYLGTRDGIRNGETLLLKRGSVTINAVTVVEVKERIFYGRVNDLTDSGHRPKVGDMVVRIPSGD